MTDKRLAEVEAMPASVQAANLLKTLKEPVTEGIPAVIQLLMWAVEEAPKMGLALRKAPMILEDLHYLTIKNPLTAVQTLLQLDGRMDRLPINGTKPEDVAAEVLNLAEHAAAT